MNKSMLALAVLGALAATAAQAETTLYGSARAGVEYTQGKGDSDLSSWDVANQASRLGVKGSEDLGGGLSAIYQYEFGVKIDGSSDGSPFSQRLSFVGLKGGFGSVTIGRQYRPAYLYVSQYTDIFNGNITNPYSLTSENQRVSDALAYVTPDFSGFSGAAAVIMNGNGQNSKYPSASSNREDIDAFEMGLGYSNGGLNIGLSYSYQPDGGAAVASVDNVFGAKFNHYGIGGSYTIGGFTGGFSYEYTDFDKSELGNIQGYGVVLGYDVTANDTVRATWGRFDWDKVYNDSMDTWGVGFEHRLSKRTMAYVEYVDSDQPYYVGSFDDEGGKYFTVGMRHDF